MPKKKKENRRKRKPRPEEERLIIRGNPQDAIDKLLKKTPDGAVCPDGQTQATTR